MAHAGAAGGAAAAAAIANAIKASGVLVRLEAEEFQRLLDRHPDPLVVYAVGGFFSTTYQYLMGYKGLAFWCRSSSPLVLSKNAEVIQARGFWIPG